MVRARFGVHIVTTPTGKWFWDNVLCDINFVPTGKRVSALQHLLTQRTNTFHGALTAIAKLEKRLAEIRTELEEGEDGEEGARNADA